MSNLQGFLKKQNGNCAQCGSAFGASDSVQSTEVSCSRCGKKCCRL